MPSKLKKAGRLSRIAVATNVVRVQNVSDAVAQDRVKFGNLVAENGVSFDSNDAIIRNDLLDKIDTLVDLFNVTYTRDGDDRLVIDTQTSTHSNRTVLDNTTASYTTIEETKMDALAVLFGVTFDSSGNIDTETYTTHTHEYEDNNGTADTTRETTGIK